MQDVSIVITQNGVTVASLLTNAAGDASATLNAGIYVCTFSYPNRIPISTTITLNHDNTMLIFAFPNMAPGTSGSNILTLPEITQTGDLDVTTVSQFVTLPVFTNT